MKPSPRLLHVASTAGLFASNLLFMWMFFASKGLERTAAERHFTGARDLDVAAAADKYAYLWRHGMVDGWPLYIPGFFAVALALAVWSRRRTLRELVLEGTLVLLAATVVGRLLAPIGTDRLVPAFAQSIRATFGAEPLGAFWSVAPIAWVKIISWSALIVTSRLSLATHSIRPVILPLALYAGLSILRRGEFGELFDPWVRHLTRGDPVAMTSTTLLLCGGVALWRIRKSASQSVSGPRRDMTRLTPVVPSCQTNRGGS